MSLVVVVVVAVVIEEAKGRRSVRADEAADMFVWYLRLTQLLQIAADTIRAIEFEAS